MTERAAWAAQKPGRWVGWLLVGCLLVVLAGVSVPQASASIVLKSFKATRQSDGSILIEWETASELDTTAFRLHRSETTAQPGPVITTLAAQGDSVTGAIYRHTDPASEIVQGRSYYYRLEELSSSGVSSWHGPVTSGGAGAGATATRRSVSITVTATDPPTATRRFTNTPVPPTPAPATPIPPQQPQPQIPRATALPAGPARVTTPTTAPDAAIMPLVLPTDTPLIPTVPPTPPPTETPTATPVNTPRPTPTESATAAPVVFAAHGADATSASPTPLLPDTLPEVAADRQTIPVAALGAIATLGVGLGLLVWALRRTGRI